MSKYLWFAHTSTIINTFLSPSKPFLKSFSHALLFRAIRPAMHFGIAEPKTRLWQR